MRSAANSYYINLVLYQWDISLNVSTRTTAVAANKVGEWSGGRRSRGRGGWGGGEVAAAE